jgi:L,D-peptidoglycan transpeptidase YkuD (ErfK/YbiS/YcfS/YnhG family)
LFHPVSLTKPAIGTGQGTGLAKGNKTIKASTLIELHPCVDDRRRAVLRIGSLTLPCAIGRSGSVIFKREGDGGTPRGILRPVMIYFRPDQWRTRRFRLPAKPIHRGLGWCDDMHAPRYNREIPLPSPYSHEKLWREDHVYDIVIETDWNRRPAKPGRGSAIFIHLARSGFLPTEGCIALDRKSMGLLLSTLGPTTRIRIH